jgi:hypothetical protein
MPASKHPANVLDQAQSVLEGWQQIADDKTYGGVSLEIMTADMAQSNQVLQQIGRIEAQLVDLRNQRDDLLDKVWDDIKRARNGIKAEYGDDSSQYQLVGGTRTSDRKAPVRKPKTA